MKGSVNLVSILTHDINNHLSATQSYLELFLSGSINDVQNKKLANNLFDLTKNTSLRLANWVGRSRILSQEMICRPVPLKISDVFSMVVMEQQSIAQNKKIVLAADTDSDISIFADSIYFLLVMRNLVNNAIKFTPPGGGVSLTAIEKNGVALIGVKDTGSGISPEEQAALFSPEWETTYGTRNEQGLGLWICKELIQKQNGQISCQSAPGVGSTFQVAIPLP